MAVTEAPAPAQDTTATVVIEQPISAPPAPTNAVEKANADRREVNRAEREARRSPEAPAAKTPEPVKSPEPVAAQSIADEPARATSKRQQQINDYERGIAERDAEIARLRAAQAPAPAPTQPEKIAESKRIASMPDYPKLANFESVEEHAAAAAMFVQDVRAREASDRTQAETASRASLKRVESFVSKLDKAVEADPAFGDKLSPRVRALKPISGMTPDERRHAGPLNILWEKVYDSPQTAALMTHFSQHPEELTRLENPPAEIAALPPVQQIDWMMREFYKLDARFDTPTPAPAPARVTTKLVTDAPEPATVLGTRAAEPADEYSESIRSRDFLRFQNAKHKGEAGWTPRG